MFEGSKHLGLRTPLWLRRLANVSQSYALREVVPAFAGRGKQVARQASNRRRGRGEHALAPRWRAAAAKVSPPVLAARTGTVLAAATRALRAVVGERQEKQEAAHEDVDGDG